MTFSPSPSWGRVGVGGLVQETGGAEVPGVGLISPTLALSHEGRGDYKPFYTSDLVLIDGIDLKAAHKQLFTMISADHATTQVKYQSYFRRNHSIVWERSMPSQRIDQHNVRAELCKARSCASTKTTVNRLRADTHDRTVNSLQNRPRLAHPRRSLREGKSCSPRPTPSSTFPTAPPWPPWMCFRG